MFARSRLPFVVSVVAAFAAILPSAPPAAAAVLPAGFADTLVIGGLSEPTAVRFSPDGRVFVAEKSGVVKVFDGLEDTTATVVADLRSKVHNFWDRGLLGLALDPGFPAEPYVYVSYTHDAAIGGASPRWGTVNGASDGCPAVPGATGDGCVVSGRVSRLTLAGDVMTGTETVLLEDWCQQYPSHTVGALAFTPDGSLIASGGDGASFNFADYGQDGSPVNPCGDPPGPPGTVLTPPTAEGGALRSQDLRTAGDPVGLSGTLVRIDRMTGAGRPGNPLASSTDANARRIVASGMRNPFRFTVRPGTGELWVGDVGWNDAEEINRIAAPADATADNFGWPCYEGLVRQPGYDVLDLGICEGLYAQSGAVSAPYYSYRHANRVVAGETCPTGGSSISGLAFYEGGTYPAEYNGALFFSDYSRRCIWAMLRGSNGLPDPATIRTVVADASGPVELQVGPGGDVFYVDLAGAVRRISYAAAANSAPTARAVATPAQGPAPLTVAFDGRTSTDPDGNTLTYAWDLDGDGDFDDATGSTASRTYTTDGVVSARLRVTDPGGLAATDTVVVRVGAPAGAATITTPASGTTWRVGETISFGGSSGQWDVVLHHCDGAGACHEHPLQTFSGVSSGSFAAPDHAYPAWLELRVTTTDPSGQTSTASRRLDPRTTTLTFDSSPRGAAVVVGSETLTTPASRTVIEGSTNSVGAASPQPIGGQSYAFDSWSDGGARNHTVVAGSTPTTLHARFAPTGVTPVVVHRVNAGGSSLAGTPAWSPDTGASPSPRTNAVAAASQTSATGTAVDVSSPTIPAGTPALLFQSERWDSDEGAEMAWSFPVTPGRYEVRLYFAEIYPGAFSPGARVFDVSVEGQVVLDDYDQFVDAGGANKGVVRSFVVDADSAVDVAFLHGAENPSVKAIEVVSLGASGPVAGTLSATPTSVSFPSTVPGSSVDRTVTLTNSAPAGSGSVVVDATSITGAGAAAYSDDFVDTGDVTLAPGASTTVTVRFAPSAAGSWPASLSVAHSASGSPLLVPLSGSSGTAAPVVVHRVNAGGPSVAGTPVWSPDTGAAPSPRTNAVAAASQTSSTGTAVDASSPTLPAGTPASLFQTERWDSDGGAEMAWSFPVTPGRYEVRLYFAEIYPGAFSAGSRVFDVSVEGQVVLDDYDQFVDAGGPNKGVMRSFVVDADSAVDIAFLHGIENPSVKAIEVLSLGAAAGTLSATPTSVTFPSTEPGASVTRTVTLTNSAPAGSGSVVVDATSITGSGAAAYSDDFVDTGDVTLAPGASTTVTVRFAPSSAGSWPASLSVAHSAAGSPLVVSLTGTSGTAAPVVVHRVNAGGPSVAGTPAWSADTGAAPSPRSNASASASQASGTGAAIDVTSPTLPAGTPASLFQTERWDSDGGAEMAWSFPVTPGRYEVRLYFAEIYPGAFSAGSRVFDVSVEGQVVLDDYDQFVDAGGANKGVMRSFVVDADSAVDVAFLHGIENPSVKAIEVLSLG